MANRKRAARQIKAQPVREFPGGEEQILIRKKELSQIVCPGFSFSHWRSHCPFRRAPLTLSYPCTPCLAGWAGAPAVSPTVWISQWWGKQQLQQDPKGQKGLWSCVKWRTGKGFADCFKSQVWLTFWGINLPNKR